MILTQHYLACLSHASLQVSGLDLSSIDGSIPSLQSFSLRKRDEADLPARQQEPPFAAHGKRPRTFFALRTRSTPMAMAAVR